MMNNKNSIIPGYSNKAHLEIEKQLQDLKAKLNDVGKAFLSNKKYYERDEAPRGVKGKAYKAMIEQSDILDKYNAEIKEYETILENGSFNIDPGYRTIPYEPSKIGYSLGNENGRAYIGRNLPHVPLDHYEDTYVASEYERGTVPETDFSELLTMLTTTQDNSIMFDSNIVFGQDIKDDDRDNVENAIAHAHDIGMVNAENKKAFEILRESKDPMNLTFKGIISTINAKLNAKGKSNAVIIVNKTGFASIDYCNLGYPMITRNSDGNFIYDKKYIIHEVDNDILPDTENSTPIIIGDMSIVKFFIIRDDSLVKDEFITDKVHDRKLKREIIALTTTSDNAYIHGFLENPVI